MNLLIKEATVLLPNGETKEADIAISGDKITSVGSMPPSFMPDRTLPAKDKLAIPGFVNTHTHAAMTLLRSYADDMKLMDWLEKEIWPIEDKMVSDDLYWGSMLAAVEMIQSGTTTFADMYGPDMRRVASVVEQSGLRAVLCRGMIGIAPNGRDALAYGQEFYRDYNGAADGRISVMLAPHSPYTCPPEFMRDVVEAAQKLGAEIHIHMSETKGEVENCLREYGQRPFKLVEESGLLANGVLAAHCVYLDEEDIGIIKKYNVRVSHNPGSNMKLASGVAPISRLLSEGVCVSLGTDGASSNNNLDMLEEVQLAALLHKASSLDPLAVPALTALRMGTEYGAAALNLPQVGKIEPGFKADIVLLDMNSAAWVPRFNPVSLLVYAANSSSVDTVLVDGQVLMEKRELKTLDEERILFEAAKCAERLASK